MADKPISQSKTVHGGIIAALAPLVQYVIVKYTGDTELATLVLGLLLAVGGSIASVGVRQAIGRSCN